MITSNLGNGSWLFLRFNFVRVVHWACPVTTTLRDGFGAFHHEGTAERTGVSGRFGFRNVLAVRIIRTAVEKTKTPAARDHFAVSLW